MIYAWERELLVGVVGREGDDGRGGREWNSLPVSAQRRNRERAALLYFLGVWSARRYNSHDEEPERYGKIVVTNECLSAVMGRVPRALVSKKRKP